VGLGPGVLKSACLSEGQRVDLKVFPALWEGGDWEGITYVIADKGYDCYAVRKTLRDFGKTPVIPRRQGAVCPGVQDKERYKTRSNIERFFGKIKENKRLCMRFDKLDATFFAFFALATLKVLELFC
jgi:transposase